MDSSIDMSGMAVVLNEIDSDSEVDIDMVEADIAYPNPMLNDSIPLAKKRAQKMEENTTAEAISDFSDVDDIEMSRGCLDSEDNGSTGHLDEGASSVKLNHSHDVVELGVLPNGVMTTNSFTDSATEAKTRAFFKAIEMDGKWARSLISTKINACLNSYIDIDQLFAYVDYLTLHVNNRPRTLTMTSKAISTQQLPTVIKKLIEGVPAMGGQEMEVPLNHSMFRLYCKNPCNTLKELAKAIISVSAEYPDVQVEYGDIFGEIARGSTKYRLRTEDLKSYCSSEALAKQAGMRVLTSFDLRRKDVDSRDVAIRWYDEPKNDGHRNTYIMFEHLAYPAGRLRFDGHLLETEYELEDDDEMVPTSNAFPAVHDLVDFLHRCSLGESSI